MRRKYAPIAWGSIDETQNSVRCGPNADTPAPEGADVERLLAYPQEDLPHHLKAQIIAHFDSEWPSALSAAERLQHPLHDPNCHPVTLLIVEDGVVSYLAIPSTVIHHAGHTYKASGLSGVITHPVYRRHGYGRQLVTAARDLIAAGDADIGVFTCDPPLVAIYTRCGCRAMEHAAIIGGTREKPFPADALGKRTRMGVFSERAKQHHPDFAGASLYVDLRDGDLW
jgi:aminoglycoside 2'-N-acetyltransferase I